MFHQGDRPPRSGDGPHEAADGVPLRADTTETAAYLADQLDQLFDARGPDAPELAESSPAPASERSEVPARRRSSPARPTSAHALVTIRDTSGTAMVVAVPVVSEGREVAMRPPAECPAVRPSPLGEIVRDLGGGALEVVKSGLAELGGAAQQAAERRFARRQVATNAERAKREDAAQVLRQADDEVAALIAQCQAEGLPRGMIKHRVQTLRFEQIRSGKRPSAVVK